MKKRLTSFYNRAVSLNQRNILDLVKKQPGAKILDLGCGDGQFGLTVAQKAETDNIYGVDLSDYHLKRAHEAGLATVKSDIDKRLPFADGSFNIIIANQIIEHLANIDLFLAEIFRVLDNAGFVIISTENGSSWINIFAALCGWQTFSSTNISAQKAGIGNPLALHRGEQIACPTWTHKTIFNFQGFKEMLALHNFQIEKVMGAGYFPLPARLGQLDARHAHFLTIKATKS